MAGRVSTVAHLAIRFLGSIRPGAPAEVDDRWAVAHLNAGEQLIWRRMSNPDRRHAVGVARDVAASLGEEATTPVLAAALMHDSGKVVSNYRTPMRVVATVVWSIVDHAHASAWLERGGPRQRLAQYRLHPELGSALLTDAAADPLTVQWARDHHLAPERWRVDPQIGAVLKACDGD